MYPQGRSANKVISNTFSAGNLFSEKSPQALEVPRNKKMFQMAGSHFRVKHQHSLSAGEISILALHSAGRRQTFCAQAAIHLITFIQPHI